MKLSAAIRIGSMTTRQIKGSPSDGGLGRCAIGAALDAVNIQPDDYLYVEQLRSTFSLASHAGDTRLHSCAFTLTDEIWMLNDFFGLTREQIADTVERYESYVSEDRALTMKEFLKA